MLKQMMSFLGCLVLLAGLTGCVASSGETDPRKGGLFGYNPDAYEQRLEERRQRLDQTEASTEQARQEGRQLEAQRSQKQAEHDALKDQLIALYAETGNLERELAQVKVVNSAQQTELARLKQEAGRLKDRTLELNNSNVPASEKQAEIDRLRRRMDELLKEAEDLSAL